VDRRRATRASRASRRSTTASSPITGVCNGIAAGNVTLTVKVSQSIGACKCITGFDKATGYLEAVEIN
jgi:hypothetical protein